MYNCISSFAICPNHTMIFLISSTASPSLALPLLVSRVRFADNVQVAVMSLSGLSSNDLSPRTLAKVQMRFLTQNNPFRLTLQCSHRFLTEL